MTVALQKQVFVRVYKPGTTSAIQSTFKGNLINAPSVGGQNVRYLQGRVESIPWQVDLADSSTSVTSIFSSGGSLAGRMLMMNRLVEVQHTIKAVTSTATASRVTLGIGRVTDVLLDSNVSGYSLVIGNEQANVRRQTIFSVGDKTTLIYPPGLKTAFGALPWSAQPSLRARVASTLGSFANITFDNGPTIRQMPDDSIKAVNSDLLPLYDGVNNFANFATLKLHFGGSDYTITSFQNLIQGPSGMAGLPSGSYSQRPNASPNVWIHVAGLAAGTTANDAYIYLAATGPNSTVGGFTSPGNLIHIGGTSGSNPAKVLLDIYKGVYGGPLAGSTIRISTAAWSTGTTGLLGNVAANVFGKGWWRVTGPANMANWIEENITTPYGIIPFIDSKGRIAPRSIQLPTADFVSQASLPVFGSSNCSVHPTWRHSNAQIVTQFSFRWKSWSTPPRDALADPGNSNPPVDGIVESDQLPYVVRHDRAAQLGVINQDITLSGVHGLPEFPNTYANYIAKQYFTRFGDGSIEGEIEAASTASLSVNPGDYTRVKLATYPNAQLNKRGGTRLVQILNRVDTPAGPNFSYIDSGSSLANLGSPTVASTASTGIAKQAIKVTLSSIPSGAKADLQVGFGTTSAAPAYGANTWRTALTGLSTGTYQVTNLPSGTPVWARARSLKAGRVGSTWKNSTHAQKTTVLATPTGLATTSISGTMATLVWTNAAGSTTYPVEVLLSTGTATPATFIVLLPSSSKRFTLIGLSTGAQYTAGVRASDWPPTTGRSALATVTFTQSGAKSTAGNQQRWSGYQGTLPGGGTITIIPTVPGPFQ